MLEVLPKIQTPVWNTHATLRLCTFLGLIWSRFWKRVLARSLPYDSQFTFWPEAVIATAAKITNRMSGRRTRLLLALTSCCTPCGWLRLQQFSAPPVCGGKSTHASGEGLVYWRQSSSFLSWSLPPLRAPLLLGGAPDGAHERPPEEDSPPLVVAVAPMQY